jgi:subfamily B ATP-binding cassette protein MsbA
MRLFYNDLKKFQDTVRFDTALYLRIVKYLKPYKSRFTIGSLASIPCSAIDAGTAFLVGPLVDQVMKNHNYHILLFIPPALIIAQLIDGIFTYISGYLTSYVGNSISRDIRMELFDKLLEKEVAYYNRHSSGDLVSRFFNDPVRLQEAVVGQLQDFVTQTISLIFLTGVLFYRNWLYAILSVSIIAFVAVPLAIISRKIRRLDHGTQEASANLIRIFYDLLHGVRLIKIYGLSGYEQKRYRQMLDRYISLSLSIVKAGIFLKPTTQLIASLGIGLVFWLGTYELLTGHMSAGSLVSFIVALLLMYKPVKTLTGIIGKIQRILAPAERVFEKLDEVSIITEEENSLSISQVEQIELKNVWFEYERNKPVLKNINMTIPAGKTIALVGQSGGGKSTLADLIPRFIDPTQGEILVNGHDLRKVKLKSLYKQMAIVTQSAFLIHDTIRENIRLGKLNATDEEIEAAAMAANLFDDGSLANGLDTWTGENGNQLSGGQRQRVTIARAFLKNPPILILDEATSALDNRTERMVQESLMKLRQGRTVIVIAHRLSTIQFADYIYVIEAGEIVEGGSHEELIAQKGVYEKLYRLQFAREAEKLVS